VALPTFHYSVWKNSFIGAAPTVSNTASYPLPNSYYNWLQPTNLRQTIMLL